MLERALQYLDRGWSVFPVQGKKALVKWRELQTTRPTREQVVQWWTEHPTAGIAVALGRVSGIIRLDADGQEAVRQLEQLGGAPLTLEFTTPAGGRGWLYQYLDGLKTEVLWSGDGEHQELRVQSDGAYTVLPPSPHPDGGHYQWVNDAPVAARVPDWLRDRAVEAVLVDLVRELRPTIRQPDAEEVLEALKYIDADDYDKWVQVGMALKSSDENSFQVWDEWSRKSPKYDAAACVKKWASFHNTPGGVTTRSILYWAEQEGYRPPHRHEPLTDLGNARILARMGEGKILHSHRWGWLAWDGKRWCMDGAAKVVQELQKQSLEYRLNQAIASLARLLKQDPGSDSFDAKRKSKMRTITLIRKHEDETRIRGSRTLAESEPALSVSHEVFDRKLFMYNFNNGTLSLKDDDFKSHDPTDMLTQLCTVDYTPNADCPRWKQFLEEILPDSGVREFLQIFLGCCMTGDTSCQLMPVFYGCGANGKSTLVETVLYVMGNDYAMKAKRDLLMSKRHAEHPTSLARLRGKRFVACVESSEDGRLDEPLVKELTGGDTMVARRMREDEWEFEPTHKVVLVTNHRPEIRGTDDGIWRRIRLIPFDVQFQDGDPRKDPELKDKLKAEAAGIINWMLDGCRAWLASGKRLPQPKAVLEATGAYRDEQDKIGAFLLDRTTKSPGSKVRVEKLMEAYISWCLLNKHQQLNGNAFGRALSERGYPLESKGSKYRLNLVLQDNS